MEHLVLLRVCRLCGDGAREELTQTQSVPREFCNGVAFNLSPTGLPWSMLECRRV